MPELDRDYEPDAELGDENDPEYRVEIFRMFRLKGLKPEDLINPQYGRAYAAWLAQNPDADS